MRNFFLLITGFFVLCMNGISQGSSIELADKVALFDKYIQSSIPLWTTTGLSVAVVKDNKVIFKKDTGLLT